jgi:hypothetical protein
METEGGMVADNEAGGNTSATESGEGGMYVVVEEMEAMDEMQIAFNELETANSQNEKDWEALLQNDRFDEVANKIKEQCIYRCVLL